MEQNSTFQGASTLICAGYKPKYGSRERYDQGHPFHVAGQPQKLLGDKYSPAGTDRMMESKGWCVPRLGH